MSERASPFQDLGDFAPKAEHKKPDASIIDQLASENGYHSRTVSSPDSAKRIGRRRAVKRGRQLNIKVTDDAAEQFYDIVDRLDVPLGRVFELAIAAYAKQLDDKASD